VPDEYDRRSWLLLAEDAVSREAVGTMRITPRAWGPLEAEEYFTLPAQFASPETVELTRFAILPAHRGRTRILPVVFAGLIKSAVRFLDQVGMRQLVVCSTPERVWGYAWMNLRPTGHMARYRKLNDAEHELLLGNLGEIMARGHRFKDCFLDIEHREIVDPVVPPEPGFFDEDIEPLRVAGGTR
jgi:hypothetical protein